MFGVWSLGFRVSGSGFWVLSFGFWVLSLRFWVWGLEFWVEGFGFGVSDLRLMAQGGWLRVYAAVFKVWGLGVWVRFQISEFRVLGFRGEAGTGPCR